MHTRTLFGVVTSLAYIGGVLWLRWPFELATLRSIPINELGDSLAGLVGPIALLWLVIGYFQQGEELRQNGDALLLQAEELKNAVDQHKEMVKATREQVTLNKEAFLHERDLVDASRRPTFEFLHCSFNRIPQEAYRLGLKLTQGKALYPVAHADVLEIIGGQLGGAVSVDGEIYIQLKKPEPMPAEPVHISITFRSQEGKPYRQVFRLNAITGKHWGLLATYFVDPDVR